QRVEQEIGAAPHAQPVGDLGRQRRLEDEHQPGQREQQVDHPIHEDRAQPERVQQQRHDGDAEDDLARHERHLNFSRRISHKMLMLLRADCPLLMEYGVYSTRIGTSQYRTFSAAIWDRISEAWAMRSWVIRRAAATSTVMARSPLCVSVSLSPVVSVVNAVASLRSARRDAPIPAAWLPSRNREPRATSCVPARRGARSRGMSSTACWPSASNVTTNRTPGRRTA